MSEKTTVMNFLQICKDANVDITDLSFEGELRAKVKVKVRIKGSFLCTDVTGSHHSYIEFGKDRQEIEEKARAKFGHITRIEECL